jgi:hypothetical protein
MHKFKQKPIKQLFSVEEIPDFNISEFMQTFVVKPAHTPYDDTPKPKPALSIHAKVEKELKNLEFSVKKLKFVTIDRVKALCSLTDIILNESSFTSNTRMIFYKKIKELLQSYKDIIAQERATQTCASMKEFKLLSHQSIVKDYMNVYTPYRGLLLYHGLGSGKTCSSIAIAEGMKNYKNIVVMCPASLATNYIEELKKCGDSIYNVNQHWEWVSNANDAYPDAIQKMCVKLTNGVWVNSAEEPNYDTYSTEDKESIQNQLKLMILTKYNFIHYNGLSTKARVWKELKKQEGLHGNPFNNKVVIVDEAHNLISRIVNVIENKSKSELISMTIYKWLKTASNCRVIFLTGTPIINYAHEIAILYNMLRGNTEVFEFKVSELSKTAQEKINKLTNVDYVNFLSPPKLLLTRSPHGFSLNKDGSMSLTSVEDYTTDSTQQFIESITSAIECTFTAKHSYNALPDNKDEFNEQFIDPVKNTIKNADQFQRRITGLTSYFPDMYSLMPALIPAHVEFLTMSKYQYDIYETTRIVERQSEKKKPAVNLDDSESSSTYRIYSRLSCNFVFPNEISRPRISKKKQIANFELEKDEEEEEEEDSENTILACYKNLYKFFSDHPKELSNYSPKFYAICEKIISNPKQLHLVYSQFITMEGLRIFSIMLQAIYGYVEFDLSKVNDKWVIREDIKKLPKFVLYIGSVDSDKREIIRNIFNKNIEAVPLELRDYVTDMVPITIFMITAAGAEGISLKRVQNVHIMEPYWNPVRIDQVIGRARRICSHSDMSKEQQHVNVFQYIMRLPKVISETTKSDTSKIDKRVITTDEYLMEISSSKTNLIGQFQNYIQKASIDCFLHESSGFSISTTNPNDSTFHPDIKEDNLTGQVSKIPPSLTVKYGSKQYDIVFDKLNKEGDYVPSSTNGVQFGYLVESTPPKFADLDKKIIALNAKELGQYLNEKFS